MASSMPFIMPDGGRLTSLLGRDEPHGRSRKAKRSGRGGGHARHSEIRFEATNEFEAAEIAAASKLGARRRTRWANERLLRSMAGEQERQPPSPCHE